MTTHCICGHSIECHTDQGCQDMIQHFASVKPEPCGCPRTKEQAQAAGGNNPGWNLS